jgi:hypothetical protein
LAKPTSRGRKKDDADVNEIFTETGIVGGHHEIADKREIGTSADGNPLQFRNNRRLNLTHPPNQCRQLPHAIEPFRRGTVFDKMGDIRSGAEITAGAFEYDDPYVGICSHLLHGFPQILNQVHIQGIHHLGTVQRQRTYALHF